MGDNPLSLTPNSVLPTIFSFSFLELNSLHLEMRIDGDDLVFKNIKVSVVSILDSLRMVIYSQI